MKKSRNSSKRTTSPSNRTAKSFRRTTIESKDGSKTSAPVAGVQVRIDALPVEIQCHILSFLTVPEQLKLATVSRRWQQAVDSCLARCHRFSMDVIPGIRYVTNQMLEKILFRLPGLRRLGAITCTELGEDLIWFFRIAPPSILEVDIISRHCPQLVEANLHPFRLDVPSLERLCRSCPKLAVLSLPKCCDDACIETVLRGLPELRSLDLDLSNVTGRCLALLPASLQRLELNGVWNLRPTELVRAARCPALRELNISGLYRPPSGELVKLLTICPRLEQLNAKECDISDVFLEQLPEMTPGVRYLNLTGCADLTEAGLKTLVRLKELRSLDLFDTNSTDSVLEQLHGALHLNDLSVGSDSDKERASSVLGVFRLVMACSSLKMLFLSYDIELEELVSRLDGQLSLDRDVTLSVPESMLGDLEIDLPEDDPRLQLDPY